MRPTRSFLHFLNVKRKYNILMSSLLKVMCKIEKDIGLDKTGQLFGGCNWITLSIATRGASLARGASLVASGKTLVPLRI